MSATKLPRLTTKIRLAVLLALICFVLALQLSGLAHIRQKLGLSYELPSSLGSAHPPVERRLGDDVILKNVSHLPRIQFDFSQIEESQLEREVREQRLKSVKDGFIYAWNGYKKCAWGHDEIKPVTCQPNDSFAGWGATLVDALDTLFIMGLKDQFGEAVEHLKGVDFTKADTAISLFETVIRYLGGLLSAYELSGERLLLQKAIDLADALTPAFSTPTGIPSNRWDMSTGYEHMWSTRHAILAEVGTLQLEFMKLAEITRNSTYFHLVQRVTDALERAEKSIPGLYPLSIDTETGAFTSDAISFGAVGDSFYEYLLKQHLYVGGALDQYRRMYNESVNGMIQYLVKEGHYDKKRGLFLGQLSYGQYIQKMEHLSCFVPGMVAMGAKTLNRSGDLKIAEELAESCYWSYNQTITGIGPEDFFFDLIDEPATSPPRTNSMYKLRPETVESLFILYRITGNKIYQDKGWAIWQAIQKYCKTESAYSGLFDVTVENVRQNDNMESFFLAETLKYLYLLFSPPDIISLDTHVFNTEAHPFRRLYHTRPHAA
ncbi:8799_t:CDS:10 [Paraglomus occultum]|uniref:alpha-1,2-Mannosidase n=1 Tax=Paraglomus occultum TaxID=144539 RepID=A0A9N8ZHU4_9GLOM|nr:8799_t:CDS:10 [Paraglomus occultum]